jgi:hypothetical protein
LVEQNPEQKGSGIERLKMALEATSAGEMPMASHKYPQNGVLVSSFILA